MKTITMIESELKASLLDKILNAALFDTPNKLNLTQRVRCDCGVIFSSKSRLTFDYYATRHKPVILDCPGCTSQFAVTYVTKSQRDGNSYLQGYELQFFPIGKYLGKKNDSAPSEIEDVRVIKL